MNESLTNLVAGRISAVMIERVKCSSMTYEETMGLPDYWEILALADSIYRRITSNAIWKFALESDGTDFAKAAILCIFMGAQTKDSPDLNELDKQLAECIDWTETRFMQRSVEAAQEAEEKYDESVEDNDLDCVLTSNALLAELISGREEGHNKGFKTTEDWRSWS